MEVVKSGKNIYQVLTWNIAGNYKSKLGLFLDPVLIAFREISLLWNGLSYPLETEREESGEVYVVTDFDLEGFMISKGFKIEVVADLQVRVKQKTGETTEDDVPLNIIAFYVEDNFSNIFRNVSVDEFKTMITIDKAKSLFNNIRSNAKLVFDNGVLQVLKSETLSGGEIIATGYVASWDAKNCGC